MNQCFVKEVKRSTSNGENQQDLTTNLCCVDPYPQSQQRHKIDNFWNKAKLICKTLIDDRDVIVRTIGLWQNFF